MSWKTAQSKKQISKQVKLALIALLIIASLILLSQTVKFTQMLFNPWGLSTHTKRTYLWDGDFNINFVIRSKSISLISFSPKTSKITIINIPDTIYLEGTHGFGNWQLGSIYDLGGDELLKDSLSLFFGLPIDGFLDFSGESTFKSSSEAVTAMRKNPFSIFKFLTFLKTDLTPVELVKLQTGLYSVRFDKVEEINLGNGGYLQKSNLADGTPVLTSDPIKLDSLISEMVDPIIQSEHKTVAIFNSTNYPNLAQKASRLITNIGGNVIIVSNGQQKNKETQIYGEKSKTLERLKQIFDASGKIDSGNKDLGSSRAQINVFLGEDFFKRL